ncbi:cephalotocin receptor 1-like [Heterodontus francisci]|uniref:cephalotocin receptor 1-like n=1 Tax=Heterodontus francisci TaxID=7792 RepID=UPI00355B3C94
MAIVIHSRGRCGLSKCINRFMMAMAAADLLVVFTDAILKNTFEMYFPVSFLTISPVCCLNTMLICAVTSASVWFTVAFPFDRFVNICCQKLKTKYCTAKMAAAIIGVASALSCSLSIPWYFAYEAEYIMDNITRGCVSELIVLIYPEWAVFDLFNLVTFIIVLLLNVLTVRRIVTTSRVRRKLRLCNNGENRKDPEMENRRNSIILLFSISGSFVLLWATLVAYFISLCTTATLYSGSTEVEAVALMLEVLSCCTNTFIYVLTQAKFREELRNGVQYFLKLLDNLFKPKRQLTTSNTTATDICRRKSNMCF